MYRTLKRNYEWALEDELLSCDASRAAAVCPLNPKPTKP